MSRAGREVSAALNHLRIGPITTGARRGLVYLFILNLILIFGSYYQSSRSVTSVRAEVVAQCKFDADLGAAPVAVNPATGKPSQLGITIVSDARVAWHGLGCPGRLAPPDPSFSRWARYYHLSAS